MTPERPSTGSSWDATHRAAFLGTVHIFEDLPPDALRALGERMTTKVVAQEGFVFFQGDRAMAVNLLAEGQVKVVRETEDGREVILRLIKPGEIFGGAGGWGEETYPASAVAIEPSVVLQMTSTDFAETVQTHPEVGMAIIQELARRLRYAESRIQALQTERVERRIARALLRLVDRTGVQTESGLEIGVPLTRQALADLCGTTLSTASRTLSAWDRQGIISAGRERVTILKPHALVAIAEDLQGEREG